MRNLLLLLLVCGISLQGELEQDTGTEELIPIIRVICEDDQMTVQIDTAFSRVHAFITFHGARVLSEANITLGDGCPLYHDKKNQVITVTVSYDSCGIEKKKLNYGTMYVSRLNTGANKGYSVSCSFPKEVPKKVHSRFEISNSNELLSTRAPFIPTILNDQLAFMISPVFANMPREFPEVYSYPAKCTIGNWKGEEDPVTILDNGCPVFDERKKFYYSSIFQPSAQSLSAEATEVRMVMTNHIRPNSDLAVPSLRLSCQVFFCTAESKHRMKGFPLCPSAAHCLAPSGKQPILKEMGGDRLVSAHLNVPINVDLSRSGGFGPIREPIPSIFHVNMTRPRIQCVESPSYSMYIFTSILCAVLGFFGGLVFFRFTSAGRYLFNATRCGREISQADPLPQPYVKLESQASGALTPDSPALA